MRKKDDHAGGVQGAKRLHCRCRWNQSESAHLLLPRASNQEGRPIFWWNSPFMQMHPQMLVLGNLRCKTGR
ncbi:unnamed protein product, partial [Vitis vinifera]|uniref:Uncharacterized protein n=1 Tax=Vitis vinifera TaxID=29760 RepID=D7SWX3_VITVI